MNTFSTATPNLPGDDFPNDRPEDNIAEYDLCMGSTVSWEDYGVSQGNDILQSNAQPNIVQDLGKKIPRKLVSLEEKNIPKGMPTLLANFLLISSLIASGSGSSNSSGAILTVSFNSDRTNILKTRKITEEFRPKKYKHHPA